MLELINTGGISLCVLDSLGAMVSNQANEKSIGELTYGGISRPLSEFSSKVTPILARTKCALIGINQLRDDLNSRFGGTTTPGGKNWRHSCSVRMDFRRGNFIDEKGTSLSNTTENPAGNLVNVHLIKSKVNRLDRKVGFYTLKYLDGIDYVSDLIDVALKFGIINQSGAWFRIVDIKTGEIMANYKGQELKFQGKSKLADFLKKDKKIYRFVLKQVNSHEK